jgi:hypothetical protein
LLTDMIDPTTTLRTARRSITRSLSAVLLVLLAAAPAAGAAKKAPGIEQSKRLWATVNVCDTLKAPDTIGIRASMPGSGIAKERMFMRFQVQFLRDTDNAWHNLGADGDSGFLPVGSARYQRREAGRNFTLAAPQPGATFRVRGVVTFEWRRGDEVVRRARKRTRSGHAGTTGADPKGFSAAECRIAA